VEFIDFRLLWEGRINRRELVTFFGISTQQASVDLGRYMSLFPNNVYYDAREKAYVASKSFAPRMTLGKADSFLGQLLEGADSVGNTFIGWRPPFDTVRAPEREVTAKTLTSILRAIRDGNDVRLVYQSMRNPRASRRWIRPHALAFDGDRWHVRAWCFENGDFRDFVLSRVQKTLETRTSTIDPQADSKWHSIVTIHICPSEYLTDDQRAAVERDYCMSAGELRLSIREALVFYQIRRLNLLGEISEKVRHPIRLANRKEIEPLLVAGAK
jgi:WYL domain